MDLFCAARAQVGKFILGLSPQFHYPSPQTQGQGTSCSSRRTDVYVTTLGSQRLCPAADQLSNWGPLLALTSALWPGWGRRQEVSHTASGAEHSQRTAIRAVTLPRLGLATSLGIKLGSQFARHIGTLQQGPSAKWLTLRPHGFSK
jgi:hypothetical protein